MKAKRFTTLLVSSVLAASMLVGCGGINKNETVATLDGQEIKLGVANFAARLQQAEADDFYRAYFGDDVWSSDLYNNGTTMEDNTKNSVIEMIENLYILQNHMADYDVTLTDDETAKIAETAAQFMADNDDKAVNALGATEDIVKEYPECKLHILGDGDERAESERLVEEYGLQKNVAFYGNIPRANLLKAVQECDAFVFPSLREGAPWSLLEAMAFRKPIVAFDLNGMHDTLSSESAILVNIDGMTPSESRTEFYKGIKRLLELSDTESCSMGAAAYKRLETVHSADGVKKYIKYIIDGAL